MPHRNHVRIRLFSNPGQYLSQTPSTYPFTQIAPAAKAARAKGMTVVTWDSPIPSGDGEQLFIAQVDFNETGMVMADMALSILGSGGGEFAVLSATPDAANQNAWNASMKEHLKGQIIWKRGDQLTPEMFQSALQEAVFFSETGGFASRWLPRAGIVFLLAGCSVGTCCAVSRRTPHARSVYVSCRVYTLAFCP